MTKAKVKAKAKRIRTPQRMASVCVIKLANHTDWSEVKSALEYYYPEQSSRRQLSEYKKVFESIKEMKKVRTDKEEELTIEVVGNVFEEGVWPHYDVASNKYSMSFRPWRHCSSLQISYGTLKHLMPADILAHFLWELTYYGFTEMQMNKAAKNVFDKLGQTTFHK